MFELPVIQNPYSDKNKPSCVLCVWVCCRDFWFTPKNKNELKKILSDWNKLFLDESYKIPLQLESIKKISEDIKIILFDKLYYLKWVCVHLDRWNCNNYNDRYSFCRTFVEWWKRCIDVSNQRNRSIL